MSLKNENAELRYAALEQKLATATFELESTRRELVIEASLEKVRARTMAMHKSEELPEISSLLFQQVKELGKTAVQNSIGIVNEKAGFIELSTTIHGSHLLHTLHVPIDDPYLMAKAVIAWKAKQKSITVVFEGQELKNYNDVRNSFLKTKINFPEDQWIVHVSFFSKGWLSFSSNKKAPSEIIAVLKRFATVFDQTYTRFLDLQKAEAQTREAQIEACLERVRSSTMAMEKSNELAGTAMILFKQLIDLGIPSNQFFIGIVNDDSDDIEFWVTVGDGSKISDKFIGNINHNPSVNKMYKGWKANKRSIIIDIPEKELPAYFNYSGNEFKVSVEQVLLQKKSTLLLTYFSQGFIGISSELQPDETTNLMARFAGVFNLAYTRFKDLKIAEAHAIQAAGDLVKLHIEKRRAEDALIELQVTQRQLIQSEKMASLGELTAGIAHEIQNPLNFVNNFSDVNREMIDELEEELRLGNLQEALTIASDLKQNEEKINHHGKRADAIVKGMLQHSRINTGEKQATDINLLADEFFKLSYHGLRAKDKNFNAEMETNFDEGLLKINVIQQDIGRVMLNLFNNAFYAVNEKRKTGGNSYNPTVSVSTSSGENKIIIIVKDNGIGIPDTIKHKIMQPFFTTKPTGEGTGLGLSLTYDMVVKGHGGSIQVNSVVDKGSEFVITLPLN
jgi:signal transduction histidine kinase